MRCAYKYLVRLGWYEPMCMVTSFSRFSFGLKRPLEEVMSQAFTSWARLPPAYEYAPPEEPPTRPPPFAIAHEMNTRLVLTDRRAVDLEVEAIIVGNNEALTDRSAETGEVFEHGGPLLAREAATHAGVRTGESRITGGHGLRARHVVHSIGPRYQRKYAAAAESALHWCYRSALQLCREHHCRTVALCALHTPRKGYPLDDGAHCALRTLRRFLEHDTTRSFDAILLVLPVEAEREAYRRIAPLYFPRDDDELVASVAHLPLVLGDDFGEISVRERQVRVSLTPGSTADVPVPISLAEGADSFRTFVSVQPSPDERACLAQKCGRSDRVPPSRRRQQLWLQTSFLGKGYIDKFDPFRGYSRSQPPMIILALPSAKRRIPHARRTSPRWPPTFFHRLIRNTLLLQSPGEAPRAHDSPDTLFPQAGPTNQVGPSQEDQVPPGPAPFWGGDREKFEDPPPRSPGPPRTSCFEIGT